MKVRNLDPHPVCKNRMQSSKAKPVIGECGEIGSTVGVNRWSELRNCLLRQIEAGLLMPGDQLSSVRTLALRYGVSINTVRRALDDLIASAFLYSVPRVGYFVMQGSIDAAPEELNEVPAPVDKKVVSMLDRARRGDVLVLNSAVPHESLTPQDLLGRCLVSVAHRIGGSAQFVPPPGVQDLRQRIAGIMNQRGVPCTAADVLITAGDTRAMELGLLVLAKHRDRILVEDPTYFGILQAIENTGMTAVPIRTDPKRGIDLSEVSRMLRQGDVGAIFLNPT